MTPLQEEQKRIAEFAAEFLGLTLRDITKDIKGFAYGIHILPLEQFFDGDEYPPILQYLGKRKIERLGFWWEPNNNSNGYTWIISNNAGEIFRTDDENEFFAFWSAVKNAVKGDKG